MKRLFVLVFVMGLMFSVALTGCAKKEATPQEAIKVSEAMATVQAKADYLVGQAKAFYNSQDYKGAIQIAQNVLTNVDKNSQVAKQIIEDAKAKIEAAAKAAVADAKKQFGVGGK